MQSLEEKAGELSDHIHELIHHFILKQFTGSPASCTDITRQEIRVIEILGKKSPCIMSEIAEQMMLAVSTLTAIIDNMVEKKLVSRERSEKDRRIVKVKLIEKGNEIYAVSEANKMRLSFGILNSLEPQEQEILLSLFRKIADKIQNKSGTEP